MKTFWHGLKRVFNLTFEKGQQFANFKYIAERNQLADPFPAPT